MQRHWSAVLFVCSVASAGYCYALGQHVSDVDEQLVRRAETVVVGRVAQQHSQWNSDRTRIVTQVTVTVDEVLKGDPNQRSLVVSVPGGEIDGVGELYTHTPRFRVSEAVVLFVERDPAGVLRVAGGEKGKVTISRDQLTGRNVIGENQMLEVLTTRIKSVVKYQEHR